MMWNRKRDSVVVFLHQPESMRSGMVSVAKLRRWTRSALDTKRAKVDFYFGSSVTTKEV